MSSQAVYMSTWINLNLCLYLYTWSLQRNSQNLYWQTAFVLFNLYSVAAVITQFFIISFLSFQEPILHHSSSQKSRQSQLWNNIRNSSADAWFCNESGWMLSRLSEWIKSDKFNRVVLIFCHICFRYNIWMRWLFLDLTNAKFKF